MTITARVKETYNKDKENMIIVKTEEGYNVTNLRTLKMYQVTNNGKYECTCPDYKYRRGEHNQGCKHIFAVKENQIQKIIARW